MPWKKREISIVPIQNIQEVQLIYKKGVDEYKMGVIRPNTNTRYQWKVLGVLGDSQIYFAKFLKIFFSIFLFFYFIFRGPKKNPFGTPQIFLCFRKNKIGSEKKTLRNT